MLITFLHQSGTFQADLSRPIDLSMLLRAGLENANCFWAPPVEYTPVTAGDFVGSTAQGGPVNFFNVRFNPHGNGTHTECVGHIARERYVLGECLRTHHFYAKLVSLFPQKMDDGDRVILREQVEAILSKNEAEALIIRTLPNDDLKTRTNWSGSNPPYLHHEAVAYLVDCGVRHLLLDLPSVDREEDGGALLAHRAFWQYPGADVRSDCTITELIFVPNEVRDGFYLLNLQTASFDLDASPSKPVIFAVTEIETPLPNERAGMAYFPATADTPRLAETGLTGDTFSLLAHGKLLLTGEYFVLDGAVALAVPVRFGQSFHFMRDETSTGLRWESRDPDGSIWFSAEYEMPSLRLLTCSDSETANTLAALLAACRRQNPDFLQTAPGWRVLTQTDFPRAWGLGTSSTLIAALGRWAGVNPYQVLFETLGGSGYDIACAFAESAVLYQLLEKQQPIVTPVIFHPPFSSALFFVYLGKKQNSRAGIQHYRARAGGDSAWIEEVSALTQACLGAVDLIGFEQALAAHERLVGQALGLPGVREVWFADFWGEIKSLGAWGGDFVLATSVRPEEEVRSYFQKRGFGTVLTWKEMVG